MPTRPILILNPGDDAAFAGYAQELASVGGLTPEALQRGLRERYPGAAVRPRDLSSERTTVWYVYRDGRWVPRADQQLEEEAR
jgi:hypothetical protein